jgi:hypothetical protein
MPVSDIFQVPNIQEEVSMSTLQIPLAEKRTGQTKVYAMTALAVVIGFAAMATSAPAVAQETKPNILFIMGDDIGWMQPSIYHRGLAVGETPKYRSHR